MESFAIIGATGLVGQKIIEVLDERGLFDKILLKLFASERGEDRFVKFKDKELKVFPLNQDALSEHFDFVFFSAGEEVSLRWAKRFAEAGAVVIDNSNAFRRESGVPLIVPEINGEKIKNSKLISNPNCSTIQLVLVLNRLSSLQKIKSVVVSTYQSVSGAGKGALDDLFNGTKNVIKEGIRHNLVPKIGEELENGYCIEEDKIMFETSKILNSNFECFATTIRVPVPYCHSESVHIEFFGEVTKEAAEKILVTDCISVSSDTLTLSQVQDTDKTYVCRIRQKSKESLDLIIVADNLRRGAAYNAVKICEEILAKNVKI